MLAGMNTTQQNSDPVNTVAVTVRIPEPLAAELRSRAENLNRPLDEIVREVLQRYVSIPRPPALGTPEERAAAIRAWAASHPRREGITMDDSRESIY